VPRVDWFIASSSLGLGLLVGLVAMGVGDALMRLDPWPAYAPVEGVAATRSVDPQAEPTIHLRDDGRPEAGRWRIVRDAMRMTEAQRRMAAELEAIGYTDGSREVTRDPTVVPVHDAERAYAGVNLYHAGHAASVHLIDMDGRPLFEWRTTYADAFGRTPPRPDFPGANHPRRVELGPEGEMYWVFEGRGVARTNLDGSVSWGFLSGAHHDVRLAPGGQVAVLERESVMHGGLNKHRPILADEISFRDRETGREQRVIPLVDALLDGGYQRILRQRFGDVLHTNSLQYITAELAAAVHHPAFVEGHWLVSLRNPSAVGIVDPERAVFTWVETGAFEQQHEAVMTTAGELHLYDNLGAGDERSRALVHELPTMRIVWSWEGPSEDDAMWSDILSVVQPLPNGNVLVVEGLGGRAFEVTRPEGDVVWQFHSPHRAGDEDQYVASLFDVRRYSRTDPRIIAVLGPPD